MTTNFCYSILFFSLLIIILTGCGDKSVQREQSAGVAVLVPGTLAENPIYRMMDKGTRSAAEKRGLSVTTIEAGSDQTEWKNQLMTWAAEGSYSLIVTSGPAMAEICVTVGKNYPDQQFLCLDSFYSGDLKIASYRINHRELSFLMGYFAGLVTSSDMKFANKQVRIGLIAGLNDSQMEKEIRPGFEIGFRTVHPEGKIVFRVVENRNNAERAAELARSMIEEGVDVIMPVAGGANTGVTTVAEELGAYVLWYDSSELDRKAGSVIGSGRISLDLAAESMVQQLLTEQSDPDTAEEGHVSTGILDFLDTDKLYIRHIPEEVRNSMDDLLIRMREGSLALPFSL